MTPTNPSAPAPYDTPLSQPPSLQHQKQLKPQQSPPPQQLHQPLSLPRSVKRPRPVKSCTECRKRKLRCDRSCPCSQCQKSSRICKYAADNDTGNLSDASDSEITDSARPTKRNCLPAAPIAPLKSATVMSAVTEPLYTPFRNGDPALKQPSLELLLDRIESLEKRLQPRNSVDSEAGGWRRSLEVSAKTVRALSVKLGGQRARLHGPGSPRVLLNLFDEAKDFMRDHAKDREAREIFSSFKRLHTVLRAEYQRSLSPIPIFVESMLPLQKRMADILPNKGVCDRLLKAYFDANETMYRIVHIPSFKKQYNRYWESKPSTEAFLPLLLTILATASRFGTKSRGLGHERSESIHLPTACALVQLWLSGLQGKQLIELDTLQVSLSLVMTKRLFREGTRDGWTALSSIVRMAMDMGLQRDPLEFGGAISPYIAEMRRRLWITVANLDYFVSNDCNMPSVLREGDFTTRPPLNVDDSELYPEMTELPPSRAFDQVTDMQIQSYSAMTLGIRLKAASLVRRVDMLTDWTEILEVGSKLERHLEEINAIAPRHGAMTNEAKNARLWKTLILLDGHVRRPLLNLYRPFTLGVPNVPPQILRGYFRSSMALMSIVEELDPTSADYEDINDMSHASLKGDIEQAAFSVCYYIRAAMRQATDSTSLAMQQALRMSPEADDPPHSGGLVLWSLPRLINTTQNVLDFLIKNIKRGDTKDIICLSVVLESVKKPNPHPEEMAYGLRVVLDSCLRSANLSLERLAAAQAETPQGELYGPARPAYSKQTLNSVNLLSSVDDDQDGWAFWDGWE
ncbi:unnamed protein product [Clonostachys rosea f. rosea IK726]|uniref:Zn(2)-C6 fungal-type domain-containing protein n=2 Tax=Bionectria ochroleuca TaxID=29856 RepID=A0A0B7KB99_BIOOC|nr:unnamed protein product [Clonostachys rosea f. rosea IK726]